VNQPWQGRVDIPVQADTLRWHQVVQPMSASVSPGFALLGFASDEGIRRNGGRPGAAAGPQALRASLANLPVLHGLPLYDAGDVVCQPNALEQAQDEFAARIADLLDSGHFPLGMGGGHEIAFASYIGLAAHLRDRGERLAVVNFDAHFDLREQPTASSGTPFLQVLRHAERHQADVRYICLGVSESANTRRLFATADRYGVEYLRDDELLPWTLTRASARLADWLGNADRIYISVCLDVLPQAVAPGVSAPSACGVPQAVVEALLGEVIATGKVVLLDVAELSPPHDRDAATSRVAARLLHRAVSALSHLGSIASKKP
jgi:formiminoglutamase